MTELESSSEPMVSADEWSQRLRVATEEAARRRAARVAARKDQVARREAGLALRHAWRQIRLDARAAHRDEPPG